MTNELRRIEQSGGSLAWLHGNKPYIRGGDFFRRQANGNKFISTLCFIHHLYQYICVIYHPYR